ncbi:hypothetical protein [Paenibacillus sp. A3]|uniref:hypothetical protein n=1 Tax=Paenibacillus sp. A3 TaxID=1337054 RepID=UPI000A705893|nr:hypothetical protein [Paenibacillus sp. A3]
MTIHLRKRPCRLPMLGLAAALLLQLTGCTALGFGDAESKPISKNEEFKKEH